MRVMGTSKDTHEWTNIDTVEATRVSLFISYCASFSPLKSIHVCKWTISIIKGEFDCKKWSPKITFIDKDFWFNKFFILSNLWKSRKKPNGALHFETEFRDQQTARGNCLYILWTSFSPLNSGHVCKWTIGIKMASSKENLIIKYKV